MTAIRSASAGTPHLGFTWWIVSAIAAALVGVTLVATGAFSRTATNVDKQAQAPLLSVDHIDHRAWDRLLQCYVNDAGLVDYTGWKSNPADIAALDEYVSSLSQADLKQTGSRKGQLAFWINAYNALTVQGILRGYRPSPAHESDPPVKTKSDLTALRLPIGDSSFSLDDIEHELLRILHEPRAHFALVCGAQGCPKLSNRAYTGADLDSQLHENAQAFFADPSKFRLDSESGAQVSPILKWYADDFGKTPTEVIKSISPHLSPELRAKLLSRGDLRISYLEYDWTLNDQAASSANPPLPPDADATPAGRSLEIK